MFNIAATSGLLRPFNFQIQPKFKVISTLRLDTVQRWDNSEMPPGKVILPTWVGTVYAFNERLCGL